MIEARYSVYSGILAIAERGLSVLVDSDDDCLNMLIAPPLARGRLPELGEGFCATSSMALAEFENPSFDLRFWPEGIKSPASKRINTNGPTQGALRPLWDLCRTGIRHLVQTGSSVDRSHCVIRSLTSNVLF